MLSSYSYNAFGFKIIQLPLSCWDINNNEIVAFMRVILLFRLIWKKCNVWFQMNWQVLWHLFIIQHLMNIRWGRQSWPDWWVGVLTFDIWWFSRKEMNYFLTSDGIVVLQITLNWSCQVVYFNLLLTVNFSFIMPGD